MSDADFTLKVTAPGAVESAADVDKLGQALTDAKDKGSESIEKLTESTHALNGEQLGSIRSARHLGEGIIEMAKGGSEAIAGLALEGRIAAEVFESFLGPAAPFVIMVSTLTAILLPMLSKAFGENKSAVEDTKKAEEELGEASEKASEKRVAAIGRAVEAFVKELTASESFNESLSRQEGYNQKALEDVNKLIEARSKLAVAELEHERQIALGGAKTGDEVNAINERFKNLIEGKKSSSESEVLSNQISASAEEIGAKTGEQNRVQYQLTDATNELNARRNVATDAQGAAAAAGVVPDGAGSYKSIREDLNKLVIALEEETKKNPRDIATQERLRDASTKLNAANRADDDTEGLKKAQEKLAPQIEKLTRQFQDLGSQIDDERAKNEVLQTEQKTADNNAKTKQLAEEQADAKEASEEAYKVREAKRKSDEESWQKQLGAQGIDPQAKLALQKKIDDAQITSDRDNLATNAGTLTEPERIAIEGRIRASQTAEGVQSGNATKAEQKTQQHTATKDDQQAVADATALIRQFGNRAELEQLKQVVATHKDKSDPYGEIMALLSDIVGINSRNHGALQSQINAIRAKARADVPHG